MTKGTACVESAIRAPSSLMKARYSRSLRRSFEPPILAVQTNGVPGSIGLLPPLPVEVVAAGADEVVLLVISSAELVVAVVAAVVSTELDQVVLLVASSTELVVVVVVDPKDSEEVVLDVA